MKTSEEGRAHIINKLNVKEKTYGSSSILKKRASPKRGKPIVSNYYCSTLRKPEKKDIQQIDSTSKYEKVKRHAACNGYSAQSGKE